MKSDKSKSKIGNNISDLITLSIFLPIFWSIHYLKPIFGDVVKNGRDYTLLLLIEIIFIIISLFTAFSFRNAGLKTNGKKSIWAIFLSLIAGIGIAFIIFGIMAGYLPVSEAGTGTETENLENAIIGYPEIYNVGIIATLLGLIWIFTPIMAVSLIERLKYYTDPKEKPKSEINRAMIFSIASHVFIISGALAYYNPLWCLVGYSFGESILFIYLSGVIAKITDVETKDLKGDTQKADPVPRNNALKGLGSIIYNLLQALLFTAFIFSTLNRTGLNLELFIQYGVGMLVIIPIALIISKKSPDGFFIIVANLLILGGALTLYNITNADKSLRIESISAFHPFMVGMIIPGLIQFMNDRISAPSLKIVAGKQPIHEDGTEARENIEENGDETSPGENKRHIIRYFTALLGLIIILFEIVAVALIELNPFGTDAYLLYLISAIIALIVLVIDYKNKY